MPATPAHAPSDQAIEHALLALLAARHADASICPSEVARALAGDGADWRALMPRVREAARRLAHGGEVQATQGQQVLGSDEVWKGPVRVRSNRKRAALHGGT
jgi:Protein of unknown function (DUF3253)